MALQSQTNNPISEFGALVRRQLWSILLPFAFVTAVGVMIAQLMPRRYEVSTLVKVPESGLPGAGEIQRDVSSAKNDMVAEPLVRSVIEAQEWSDYVGLTKEEKVDYVKRVIKNIKPTVSSASKNSGGSNYITVFYFDSEGSRAEKFLNNLRDRYIEGVVAGVRADAIAKRDKLKDLRDEYYGAYKAAEKAKSDLIKLKDLASAIPSPGSGQARGEDPVAARLQLSRTQLLNAETELKKEQASLDFIEHVMSDLPDQVPESEAVAIVSAGGKPTPVDEKEKEIRALKTGIADKREKLKDYRPPASAYKRLEAEITKDEKKLADLEGLDAPDGTSTAGSPRFVRNPKLANYEQRITEAKTRVEGWRVTVSSLKSTIADLERDHLARMDAYAQLAYLDQDVLRAEQTYLGADRAYEDQRTRVSLQDGPLANPFDVVEVAKASDVPNAPNVPMFILISALLGLAAGMGTALTSEFLRNGFRGIPDLTRGLAVPVLGAVNQITTRVEARRKWTRHAMIAGSSAVIVCSILYVTWAYQHDPLRLLGPRLTQLITDVRLAFRL